MAGLLGLGPEHDQNRPYGVVDNRVRDAAEQGASAPSRLEPGWVALITALAELERNPHHWPVGKTTFQKLAYFATAAGIPTGLRFERSTYGPYSSELDKITSRLVNNDLLEQAQLGQMVEMKVGPTYASADHAYAEALSAMRPAASRSADLLSASVRSVLLIESLARVRSRCPLS